MPSDFRPVTPERIIWTKFRSIFELSITRAVSCPLGVPLKFQYRAGVGWKADGKKVNINQASSKDLANLPRIGSKVADRIVEYRQAHGAFARGVIDRLLE